MIYKLKAKSEKRKAITQNLKFYVLSFSFMLCALSFALFLSAGFCQEVLSSKDYVTKSWEAIGERNFDKVLEYTNKCIDLYKAEADKSAKEMTGFPLKEDMARYQILNDVATCYFIQAEALMRQGKNDDAIQIFKMITERYKYAQAWDPKGWYWSVAEIAQVSIDKLTQAQKPPEKVKIDTKIPQMKTELRLYNSGTEDIIDYKKYGKFYNIGAKNYRYEVIDPAGLVLAAGEGIYPNTSYVIKDPAYRKAQKEGRLEGSHWDFIYGDDLEANFYKWATAPEPWGIKLFYIGMALERARLYKQAIKAYYSIVVHFPNAVGWTYWHTPWYPGQAAISKIRFLCRRHPELKMRLADAKIQIINGFDNDISNDIVITNPGKIINESDVSKICARAQIDNKKISDKQIVRRLGSRKVQLVQFKNKHWQLRVNGKPYVIQAVTYTPTKVGQSPDEGTLANWMFEDTNNNGKIDGPYDAWVDKNRNSIQDTDEPVVGDFQLMKEMGVNTIRLYHQPFEVNKELLRDLYKNYGIMVIMGDFIGKYALGSGAKWAEGTDYANPEHQENMLNSVKKMVMEFKDEPYVLMWLLGNENNYGLGCNADKKPESYYRFANEAAKLIKSLDKDHPVAISNGDTLFLDIFAKNAPDIDIFAANVYRGDYGFGSFWEQVMDASGRPAFITEYGCPAYGRNKTIDEAEGAQADYHSGCWEDFAANMAGTCEGVGNALGGVAFEWLDEWWKAYEPSMHDTKELANGPFPDGYYYEEWFGFCSQGEGASSPFLRWLRKSYYYYQNAWMGTTSEVTASKAK